MRVAHRIHHLAEDEHIALASDGVGAGEARLENAVGIVALGLLRADISSAWTHVKTGAGMAWALECQRREFSART